jgi:hypothetical protein
MRTIFLSLVFVIACGGSGRTGTDADTDAVAALDAALDASKPPSGLCGGLVPVECRTNEYCDYADNSCGIADAPGVCKRRPDACPLAVVGQPVCGCDGKIHVNECIAFSDGADLSANGGCPLPADSFACGYAVCDLRTQYCRRDTKVPDADVYQCATLPQGCTACPCLAGELCGDNCSGSASAGLTLTCA